MHRMTVEPTTILALLIALGVAGLSIWREQQRPQLLTREKQLEQRAEQLEATVQTLLTDRNNAQRQIDLLRKELEDAKTRILQLEAELARYVVKPGASAAGMILAAIGTDPALQADLAALRKVQQRTGLRMSRLLPVTMANLERTLDRHRKNGETIRNLHLGVHAGPEGLLFGDGLATGKWLSEHLAGVEVMVIAGCESDAPGDWVSVVPAVVSMREKISHQESSIFTELFWQAIGEGLPAETAFERALDRCPPAVAEFAELHV